MANERDPYTDGAAKALRDQRRVDHVIEVAVADQHGAGRVHVPGHCGLRWQLRPRADELAQARATQVRLRIDEQLIALLEHRPVCSTE